MLLGVRSWRRRKESGLLLLELWSEDVGDVGPDGVGRVKIGSDVGVEDAVAIGGGLCTRG